MRQDAGQTGEMNMVRLARLNPSDRDAVLPEGRSEGAEACPCCGYRTLEERCHYEICNVCGWEDDGQDNENADESWGGPNGNLSLSQARANFLVYGTCEAADPSLPHGQKPLNPFTRVRHFTLVEGGSVIEESAVSWRSRPLGPIYTRANRPPIVVG